MKCHPFQLAFLTIVASGLSLAVRADEGPPVQAAAVASNAKQNGEDKTSDSKSTKPDSATDKSKAAQTDGKEKAAPSTYTVKEGPFKVELALDGLLESKRNSEITIHPDSWSDWTVATAVEQGTNVKQGDMLIEFDTTKIDEQIRDLMAERKLAQLSLDQLASDIHLLEQSMPLDLQMAERASRLADADLERFASQDRELAQREAEHTVKARGNQLDYVKEELKQLEKMYKGDDLTKETEEIVLKRTRDELENMQFEYDLSKVRRDRTLKIELPRREETLKENVNRTALALQKAKTSLPITLDKQRLELEKQKVDREKAAEKLAKLQRDRGLMKVTSPADGRVYYGTSDHGRWAQAAQLASKLRKGGHVSADEVLLTVVDPGDVVVSATVPEKELWQLRRGLTGSAIPEGYNELRLPASLDEFSRVPTPEGKYLATVLVDFARLPKDVPIPSSGMKAKIKLNAYSSDHALTLPAKAIQTDQQNDEARYVWLLGSDGKPNRRNVTIGHRTDSVVEITEGLAAGDNVLREPPKDEE